MIDFLEKIYSYEYFPQILFGTIAVLLILLVIVVLFGKKDEKIRKEEETKRLELAGLETFTQEQESPVALEVTQPTNEEVAPVLEPTPTVQEVSNVSDAAGINMIEDVQIQANDLINNAINTSIGIESDLETNEEPTIKESNQDFMIPDFEIFKEEEKIINQPVEVSENEIPLSLSELHQKDENMNSEESEYNSNLDNTAALPEFNFDELASSINKELDEINKLQEQANVSKETTVMPSRVNVTPIKEVTKFTPSSVFSSVYINKEKELKTITEEEPIALNKETKPVLEEKVEEEIPVIKNIINEPVIEEPTLNPSDEIKDPIEVKPIVNNPFIFDMPAKKEEPKEELVKTEENIVTTNIPDFSAFENETYDIK